MSDTPQSPAEDRRVEIFRAQVAHWRAEQWTNPALAHSIMQELLAELSRRSRVEQALLKLLAEPHFQGSPLLLGRRDSTVVIVSAEWYRRLRDLSVSPSSQPKER